MCTNELAVFSVAASRAKMASVKAFSKIRGQTNQSLYPQVEGQLGECLIKYGRELGDNSLFGEFNVYIIYTERGHGRGVTAILGITPIYSNFGDPTPT